MNGVCFPVFSMKLMYGVCFPVYVYVINVWCVFSVHVINIQCVFSCDCVCIKSMYGLCFPVFLYVINVFSVFSCVLYVIDVRCVFLYFVCNQCTVVCNQYTVCVFLCKV